MHLRSFFLAALLLTACRPGAPAGPVVVTPADRAEAAQLYRARCASCHGVEGAGDGVAGRSLVPPPRSFREVAWQKAVTDTRIEQVILVGGAPWGLSPLMPANPDLGDRRAVLAALREQVRAFGHSDIVGP